MPGDGGSQIEAKLNKDDVPHYFCDRSTDFFSLWLNLELLVPFVIDCWVDNMKLIYDNVTRTTRNNDGVAIQIPGFGNTTSVEYVDSSRLPISGYFNIMADQLVKMGYQRGVDLRGAPYDFRKAPNELGDYMKQVKALIEETYQTNKGRKVVLLCHSMGCSLMLYLLNRQPQQWKDQYVKSLFTLAGPWGGAVKSVKAFASGDNFGVIVVPTLTIRDDERTFPSLAYLLPSDNVFASEKVVVQTEHKQYTVGNYGDLFKDINYQVGYNMWVDVRNLTYDLTPPGVEVYCVHGTGLDTMDKLIYEKNRFPDEQPDKIEYADGDGTVNVESLQACSRWKGQQSQPVHYMPVKGLDHMQVLYDLKIMQNLLDHAAT